MTDVRAVPARRGLLSVAAVFCISVAAVLLVGAPTGAHPAARSELWKGHLKGDRKAKVSLSVEFRHGQPIEALFGAHRVQLACDNGTTIRRNVFTIEGDVFDRRTVAGDFAVTTEAGLSIFQRFTARMSRRDRAEGTLIYIRDPYDPPLDPMPAECSTDGTMRWTATKTGG